MSRRANETSQKALSRYSTRRPPVKILLILLTWRRVVLERHCVVQTCVGATLCIAKLRKRNGMQFLGQVELERQCSLANLCKGNDAFCGSSVCDNLSNFKGYLVQSVFYNIMVTQRFYRRPYVVWICVNAIDNMLYEVV